MKTDQSIKNICIAAIKMHTILPIHLVYTTLFDTEEVTVLLSQVDISEDELLICQVFLDPDNWTLVTTRRILSNTQGVVSYILATEIKTVDYNLLKKTQLAANDKDNLTKGEILNVHNQSLPIFIELGKPAIVMVYAIDTLQQIIKK